MAISVCVLRSGGDFKPEHVYRLKAMIKGMQFLCLSDVPLECDWIPLQKDWPGWWSKLEIFSPTLCEDIFYLDLDTTVLKMPTMPDRTTVLRDFGDPGMMASGLMFIKHEDKAAIWEAFNRNPQANMAANVKWPNLGDQGFLQPFLKNAQRWQHIAKVYSFKNHCKHGVPEDAEVICYHGKPRPWD